MAETSRPVLFARDIVVIGGCGHVGLPLAIAFASRGAPVDWVPLEPVFVQLNTLILAAQSRHPNATKLFIDFVLSKKGQEMIRSFHRVPARTGVDAEPPRIFKGFKRVVQDIETAASGEETTKLYNEILNIR